MDKLTQSRLKELFKYHPESGVFVRRIGVRGAKKGEIAGCVDYSEGRGYIVIKIDRIQYQAHRLAWLYMTGYWPQEQIDHINHNRSDNRWNNLREVTHQENQRNSSMQKNNKSGVTGVCWLTKSNRWQANIKLNGKNTHLGTFKDKFEAICVRKSAENKYGFHPNHGEK